MRNRRPTGVPRSQETVIPQGYKKLSSHRGTSHKKTPSRRPVHAMLEECDAKGELAGNLVSQTSLTVFVKSFRKSQFPHKSVNLFLMIKDELTNSCEN